MILIFYRTLIIWRKHQEKQSQTQKISRIRRKQQQKIKFRVLIKIRRIRRRNRIRTRRANGPHFKAGNFKSSTKSTSSKRICFQWSNEENGFQIPNNEKFVKFIITVRWSYWVSRTFLKPYGSFNASSSILPLLYQNDQQMLDT